MANSKFTRAFLLNLSVALFTTSAGATNVRLDDQSGDVYKLLGSKRADIDVILLTGAKSKYTMNNPTLYLTDPVKVAYVNYMLANPKDKWISTNIGALTPAQLAEVEAQGKWCDENDMCYTRIDNQVRIVEVNNGASLSTNKPFYASGQVGVYNNASFTATAPFMTPAIMLETGGKLTLSKFKLDDLLVDTIQAYDGSTIELSNGEYQSPLITINYSALTAKTAKIYADTLTVDDDSTVTLTGSQVFAENLSFDKSSPQYKLSATLSNNSILSGHETTVRRADLVLNNSTIGNQPIAILTEKPLNASYVEYDRNASSELTNIQYSRVTLNGNSSIRNSLLHEINNAGKTTFAELSPTYFVQNSAWIAETLQDGSLEALDDFSNNIYLDNSTITMNGTSSIVNNSFNTSGQALIKAANTARVNVLGKNTFTATGAVRFESNSTLNVAKGAVLNVQTDYNFETNRYDGKDIDLDCAYVTLAGTLNGNISGWARSITLAPTMKINGNHNFTGTISGFGLSGVNNVKTGSELFRKFDELAATADTVSLNTFTMDNSKLSVSMLSEIRNTHGDSVYGILGDMHVENKSTLTVDNRDDESYDLTVNNMTVTDSTITLNKDAEINANTLAIYDSTVTATGNVTNGFGLMTPGTWISAADFEMDNSGKPQTALTLTNAGLTAYNFGDFDGNIFLRNTNVKMTGNIQNVITTAMVADNDIDILNDENTKATVAITGADMSAVGDITMTNTSFNFAGDAKRYDQSAPNFISTSTISIDNEHNTKATVNMSKADIYADELIIGNSSAVNLTNLRIADKHDGSNNETYIRYGKTATLSNVRTVNSGTEISNFESLTVDKSYTSRLGLSWIDKVTVKGSEITSELSLWQTPTATVSDTVVDGPLKVWAFAPTVVNPGPKQKIVYSNNTTVTNTNLGDDWDVRNANLTIGKGNTFSGELNVQGSGDLGVDATHVLVKEDLNTGSVVLEKGTIDVAAKKRLTAFNLEGFTLNNDSKLLVNGKTMGDIYIDSNKTATVVIANNDAQLLPGAEGNVIFGNKSLLEFKNVKGTLNGFIPVRSLVLNDVKLTNSTLTYDRYGTMVGGDFSMSGSNLYLGSNTFTVAGTANIYDKSTLYMDVTPTAMGSLVADTINLQTKADGKPANITLAVTMRDNPDIPVGAKLTFLDYNHITGNLGKVTIANNRYNLEEYAVGQFEVTGITTGKGVVERYSGAVNPGVLMAARALVDRSAAFSDPNQELLANQLDALSQVVGGEEDYIQALSATNPDDSAMVQTNALMETDAVLDVVSNRMSTGGVAEGMSSGDIASNAAVWGQALYNRAKLDTTSRYQGFKGNSKGVALGFEKDLNDALKIGLAYAYTQSDIKSSYRKMDADTHGLNLYGEYKPSNWFVNAIAGLAWSDYEAKAWSVLGTTKSDFDVYTYSAQATTGYQFDVAQNMKITPSAGLRYINFRQKSYTDSDHKRISATNADILTAMLGATFNGTYTTGKAEWTPFVKLGLSYDLHSKASNSIVSLSNGTSYYVPGRHLKRLGLTGGVGTEVRVGNWDLSIGYDLDARKEYRNHTGALKAKYHF